MKRTQQLECPKLVIEILRCGEVIEKIEIDDPRENWCNVFNSVWASHGLIASPQLPQPVSMATKRARA